MSLNQRWQFTFDLVPIIQQVVIPYVKNIHENPSCNHYCCHTPLSSSKCLLSTICMSMTFCKGHKSTEKEGNFDNFHLGLDACAFHAVSQTHLSVEKKAMVHDRSPSKTQFILLIFLSRCM